MVTWNPKTWFKRDGASGAGLPEPQAGNPKVMDSTVVSVDRARFAFFGESFPRVNEDELIRTKGVQVYARMRTDEQVKAAVTFKRDAILSRGWTFEFDKESKLPESKRKERVRLFEQIVRKLPGSFIDALNVVSVGREYGFSLTEKVYQKIEVDGKTYTGLKGLYGRDPSTFNFFTDIHGDLVRCEQEAAGQKIEIDLDKFVHYVHNPEFDRWFGRSDLREAYRHWYCKDVLLRLWPAYLERFGSGFLIAQLSQEANIQPGSQAYADLQQALTYAKAGAGIIAPAGVTITAEFPAAGDGYEKACTWFDLAIAKSLLVPNLAGVSHTGQTGAYSQAQTQLEAFAWTLKADAERLQACIDEQLFRDLGEQNWGDDEYPCFTFKPLSTEQLRWMIDTWLKMVSGGAVIATEIDEARLREILEMPPRDESAKPLVDPAMDVQHQQGKEKTQQQHDLGQEAADADVQRRLAEDKKRALDPVLSEAEQKKAAAKKFASNQKDDDCDEFPNHLNDHTDAEKPRYPRFDELSDDDDDEVQFRFDPNQPRDKDGKWSADDLYTGGGTFYHVTPYKHVEKIMTDGLVPGRASTVNTSKKTRGFAKDKVFVTLNRRRAVEYARLIEEHKGQVRVLRGKLPKGTKLFWDGTQIGPHAGKDFYHVGKISTKHLSRQTYYHAHDSDTFRPLIPAEKFAAPRLRDARVSIASARERVDFAVIDRKQTELAETLKGNLALVVARSVRKELGDDEDIKRLTDQDTRDIGQWDLPGIARGRIKVETHRSLGDAWALGRDQAQRELRKSAKVVPIRHADLRDNAAQYFESTAFKVSGDVSDRARSIIQQELLISVKVGRSPGQTRTAIWDRLVSRGLTSPGAVRLAESDAGVLSALDDLWKDTEEEAAAYLDTVARTNLFTAMNEARYAEFTDPALGDFVVGFRYSAILDDRTTEVCQHMNDRIFNKGNELWDAYRPPNHFNCRSVLVPLTQLDVEDGLWNGVESEAPTVQPQEGFGS